MSLDLTRVASQVGEMLSRLKSGLNERQEHLKNTMDTVSSHADRIEDLRKKIASGRTTWLVADPVDGLDGTYKAPPLPSDFTVLATDGSHIDVDRHRSARCYLINIGSVALKYGKNPDALLGSKPSLYTSEEDLVIAPTGTQKGREQSVEGGLLGIKRGVDECKRLVELAEELPTGSSSLALLDGTLILWGLEAYPEFVAETLLDNGFLECLSRLKEMNKDKRIGLASFISLPRATDVVNALRVAVCPYEPPNCDVHCPGGKRDCDTVAGVRDRELFNELLDLGERSPLFINQSSVVTRKYGEHKIYFFYIKLEDEIARVEVPQWVAQNSQLLSLTHSLVLDQCQRGQGYPVALSEAHEQAVVSMSDRENFWHLVESSLIEEKMPTSTSGKNRSKRTRWV